MNLKKKTIQGLIWAFTSQIGKQGSQFIITAILARLLSPSDFGLLGMATVFTGFATIFSDLGVSGALVQKQDTDERHLSSAFWLNIITGLILTVLFIVTSGLIAKFYNMPELKMILVVMSFNYILASFTIIQQTILTKEMDFKKLTIRDIIAVICGGIVGIILAYKGFGVWSLVYQLLASTIVNGILLWILSKWRPKFIFSISAIKDIAHFSTNFTGFSLINYVARNVDYLLIGRFLGAEALGFYTLAYNLMLFPLFSVSWVIHKVMFPALSKIQHDLERVRRVYTDMVKTISLVTFPMMFMLFAIAPEFIRVIFGQKWEASVKVIQILCVCGLIQSIGTTVGTIYQSQGKVWLQFRMALINTALSIFFIYTGLRWGIIGVAACYSLYAVAWVHVSIFVTTRIIKLPYVYLYLRLLNSYLIGSCLLIFVWGVKFLIKVDNVTNLAAVVVCGMVFYGASMFMTKEAAYMRNIFQARVIER